MPGLEGETWDAGVCGQSIECSKRFEGERQRGSRWSLLVWGAWCLEGWGFGTGALGAQDSWSSILLRVDMGQAQQS